VRRSAHGSSPGRVPDSVHAAVGKPGRPLPERIRERAETFFGADLGHVRLHDDSLAATAVAESLAHALAVGPNILLSRHMRDLSRSVAQRTLAHEIAHTLQPDSGNVLAGRFDHDGSDSEVDARNAAKAFLGNTTRLDVHSAKPARRGVSRERDPRLDGLVRVIENLARVLTERGVAGELDRAAPGLDLSDPDNYEPLQLLIDESFGPGTGASVVGLWMTIQASAVMALSAAVSRPHSGRRASAPVPDRLEAETSILAEGGYSERVVAEMPPRSMLGSAIRGEIDTIRARLGMPALNEDAPASETFEPMNSNDLLRLDRLHALEAEYYQRRRMMEGSRELTGAIAQEQREPGIGLTDVLDLATMVTSPETMAIEAVSAVLGHPVEDFATGFLPGFLGGAVLELPSDAFERLDAETREHPIQFNGGVLVGIPVGAAQGLGEMLVGLAQLLGLTVEYSPVAMAVRSARDAYRMITDFEGYQADQARQLEHARAVGEAIVSFITSLLNDQAFMISHGRELGEIAGRASANWFNEDFMRRSTFDKGYLVGRVEGRIIFEIVALFVGPEEWIARGATAVGEVARLSGPLRRAITDAIEHIPALRRLLAASREATIAARDAMTAERALAEGGEAISKASRLGEGASDLRPGSGLADEGARAAEESASEARRASGVAEEAAGPVRGERGGSTGPEVRGLDPGDLRNVGEVNPGTVQFFREHPDRLHAWAQNAEATRVCKLCSSPCFPKNVTASQTERLEALVERARGQGIAIEDHALHDPLKSMNEAEIDLFIDSFESRLDDALTNPNVDSMVDLADRETLLGRGEEPLTSVEPDPDLSPVDRIFGRPSEAAFSGDVGEGMEAAVSGATSLPQTYAQRFSVATREELRQIFTEFGKGALRAFVNRLGLPRGGLRQVEIPTAAGLRRVDRLFTEGDQIVLREVKNYPRAILNRTKRIADELSKDEAILARFPEARIDWHITGNVSNDFMLDLQALEAEWAGRFRLIRGTPFNIIP